jgi:NurA-like 5'-3' nuclease
MIKLNKENIISFFNANKMAFENYPVIQNFLTDVNSWSLFDKLCKEIRSSKELYDKIATLLGAHAFEIDDQIVEIKNGFELARLVKDNSIEISEGEATWIDLLFNLNESNKSACCSTRSQIFQQAETCYNDLVSQCNSEWIFVKNIKTFCKVSTIVFYKSDRARKEV